MCYTCAVTLECNHAATLVSMPKIYCESESRLRYASAQQATYLVLKIFINRLYKIQQKCCRALMELISFSIAFKQEKPVVVLNKISPFSF